MINYVGLRAKLEESIAQYEQAIAAFDAFISEYGLQDAFNEFLERAGREVEGNKMTLDEAEDTGGNHDEADIEKEIEKETQAREEAADKEEENKKKLTSQEERDKNEESTDMVQEYLEIQDLARNLLYFKESIPIAIDQYHIIMDSIRMSDSGDTIEFSYQRMNLSEKEHFEEFVEAYSNAEDIVLQEKMDLDTGHIRVFEYGRSREKGLLIALVYAMKRMCLNSVSLHGENRQIKDLLAPLEQVLEYEALSRTSYDLFSSLHLARVKEILAERDDLYLADAAEMADNEEYEKIYDALKAGDTAPLKSAYERMDKAVEKLRTAALLYPDAGDIIELAEGEADPCYFFKDITEVQEYARNRIYELENPGMDKKRNKSR